MPETATFSTRPKLEPVPRDTPASHLAANSNKMRLIEDWHVTVDGVRYKIPRGFITDGLTIPRFLWWIFPPSYSPGYVAAVFHDFCYAEMYGEVSKEWADEAFRLLMLDSGAPNWVARAFWLAVRSNVAGGGW